MEGINKIIVPVDLSDNSHKIVPYVIAMAKAFNAKVHLLFVVHVIQNNNNMFVPTMAISGFETEIVEDGKRRLDQFSKEFFEGLCVYHTKVKPGVPSEEIIKEIKSEDGDLVIIGTHGRKGFNRILFGSVAEYVVKKSPVPVMTINPYRVNKKQA